MSSGRSFQFNHCVTRRPGNSIAGGLRAGDQPDPDPRQFRAEHGAYVETLAGLGITVTTLPSLETLPDSVFVEDAALCCGGTAVILRPGAPSRADEGREIEPHLSRLIGNVVPLQGPGQVDGGDILLTDDEAFIGLSDRTNLEGANELRPVLEGLDYKVNVVETPEGVLHFKSDCGLLDSDTIFSTTRLAKSGCFDDYQVIECPEGEEAAANLIRVNDCVILRSGFPATCGLLEQQGYTVMQLDAEQAALVDGGLSCMSLRFWLD
jgi:dimethylargininase